MHHFVSRLFKTWRRNAAQGRIAALYILFRQSKNEKQQFPHMTCLLTSTYNECRSGRQRCYATELLNFPDKRAAHSGDSPPNAGHDVLGRIGPRDALKCASLFENSVHAVWSWKPPEEDWNWRICRICFRFFKDARSHLLWIINLAPHNQDQLVCSYSIMCCTRRGCHE